MKTRLQYILRAFLANHQWHIDYDDYAGYSESDLCNTNIMAIALLEKMIGEIE